MKKKLFFFACLIIAICAIFAISASAATPDNSKETFTLTTGQVVALYDTDGDPLCWYYDENGTLTCTKSTDLWYEVVSSKLYSVWTQPNKQGLCLQTCDNTSVNRIVVADFRHLSITTISNDNLFKTSTTVEYVRLPDTLTEIKGFFFYGASNLQRVYIPKTTKNLTFIGPEAFNKCTKLYALYLPEGLTTTNELFQNSTQARTTPFQGCHSLYFVSDPDITTKEDIYYFPSSLTTMYGEVFDTCKNLNNVLVFGENVTILDNAWTFENVQDGNGGKPTVVFLGNMDRVNTGSWGVSKVIFANPADKSSSDFSSYSNSKTTVFCASESDMTKHLESPKHSVISEATCYSNKAGIINCFCGREISRGEFEGTMLTTHDYIDDFDCTTPNYCKNFGENKCDKFLVADAIAHNEAHDVIFANGFTSAGVHNTYCSNATCKALDKVEDLDAMFTHEGYAYKERTSGGIDTKFKINTKAMKLYEQYEGAIHFGIIIANASHFENVDVFIQNGELTSTNAKGEKTGIIVEMTSRDYDYFNCYIGGFDFANENHVGLDLIVAGYVYGENESDISFIQKQYKTDDNDATLEIPYTAMVTKGATLKAVNIVTVRDFIPLVEKTEE